MPDDLIQLGALIERAVSAALAAHVAPVVSEALTAAEAAKLIGISRSQFFNLDARGLIPARVEVSDRSPRWLRGELLAWLRASAPSRSRWLLMRDSILRRTG